MWLFWYKPTCLIHSCHYHTLTCCWAPSPPPPTSQSDRWGRWEHAGCLSHSGRTPVRWDGNKNSRLFKKKHRQTSRITPNYPSQHHLHSWTSRTGRLTPLCWKSSPGCLSRNASRKPGGADELQDGESMMTVKLATTNNKLLSFDGAFLAFVALI